MANAGITFEVSQVAPGKAKPALDVATSVRSLLAKPVEAMHCAAANLVVCDTMHPFATAAHDAFYGHLPLVIRPDDVWFCIAQGFAAHVNLHAEALRDRFVRHQGRQRLTVRREDFVLGAENPWPEVFAEFSTQIGEHVGKLRNLVGARFTTTTDVEIAAFDVALMDTFQGYFEYELICGCGIPQITLLGTPADWISMIPRVQQLAEYGLEHWTRALLPIMDELVNTAAGQVDREFWQSMFRYQSGSGPAEMTGWIHTLFPYVIADHRTKALGPNPFLATWQKHYETALKRSRSERSGFFDRPQGPSIAVLPSGLVSAPVKCSDWSTGKEHALRFVAGMFGVDQDPTTLALSAAFGWGIVYDQD
jgi:hypothetical protein